VKMQKRKSLIHGSVALLCVLLLAPVVSAQVIVPDVTGSLLPDAAAAIVGAGFVVGDVVPMFDDVAPCWIRIPWAALLHCREMR